MKRLILLLSLLLPTLAYSQGAPQLNVQQSFTAAGNGLSRNVNALGLGYYKVSYTVSGGTVSACNFDLASSKDNITFTNATSLTSLTCTSDGQTALIGLVTSYVRLEINTFTVASGIPILTINTIGYVEVGGTDGGITSTVDIDQTTNGTTNAVSVKSAAGTGIAGTGTSLNVACTTGCSGGTTDTDDGTITGAQVTGIQIGMSYIWNGTVWVRSVGDATNGTTVNLGTNNDVTVTSGAITATVTDGAGALNTIVDSGTLTAVTTITNPVTVTDGAGALNAIIDSGTITTVSTITNDVVVTGTGAVVADSIAVRCVNAANNAFETCAGSGSGGTSAEDNDAFTGGTTGVNPIGAIYDATPPTITDGSVGTPRMSSTRILLTDGSNATQPVSGTVTVTDGAGALNTIVDSGTITAITNALPAGTNNIGDVDIVSGTLTAVTSITNPVAISQTTNGTTNGIVVKDAAGNARGANVDSNNQMKVVTPGITYNTTPTTLTDTQVGDLQLTSGQVLKVIQTVGTSMQMIDPCQSSTSTMGVTAISIAASATIVTGTAALKTYVCSIDIVTDAAVEVAVVAGTGTLCATSIAAMWGGTTAATGWSFAANSGLTKGDGGHWVNVTETAQDNICFLLSSAIQVSGSIKWAKAP